MDFRKPHVTLKKKHDFTKPFICHRKSVSQWQLSFQIEGELVSAKMVAKAEWHIRITESKFCASF